MKLLAVIKRVIPFMLGLTVGVLPAWLFSSTVTPVPAVPVEVTSSSYGSYCNTKKKTKFKHKSRFESDSQSLRIDHKPQPGYTNSARREAVEGTVTLRVEFLASGRIGDVIPVQELPAGLTEEAIKAARKIKFEPATRDGIPVTTFKQVEYEFSIY